MFLAVNMYERFFRTLIRIAGSMYDSWIFEQRSSNEKI